jgi:oxaloacetate decarboxylase gamma subunit
MLEQSGVLTLLGMGIVFSFLIIMIIVVSLMGKVIRTIGVDKDTNAAQPAAPSAAKTTAVAAAITAAVNEYRANR